MMQSTEENINDIVIIESKTSFIYRKDLECVWMDDDCLTARLPAFIEVYFFYFLRFLNNTTLRTGVVHVENIIE